MDILDLANMELSRVVSSGPDNCSNSSGEVDLASNCSNHFCYARFIHLFKHVLIIANMDVRGVIANDSHSGCLMIIH